MLSLKKKTLMWGLTAALVGTVGLVAFADNKANIFQATDSSYTLTLDDNNGKIAGAYSTTEQINSTATTPSGNSFSMTYYDSMASTNSTNKYAQLRKSSGYVFSTKGVKGLTSVKVAFSVGSGSYSPSLYVSDTNDFSSSTAVTLTSGTAVSVSHNYFKIAAGASVLYIGSIVLTYSCTGTVWEPSSTPVSSDAYSLISSTSDLVVGDSYIIGNKKVSGSAKFLANAYQGSLYQASTDDTITDGLLVTPTAATEEFILGGASGAYTFTSTKRSTNGYLSANDSYSYQLDLLEAATLTDYNKWSISFSSTSLANIINNGHSRYVYCYTYGTQIDFECDTSSNVYLYHKSVVAAGPSLTISPTSLSLTAGSSDGTITATPATGATLSITNSNDTVATATLTNETVTVHPLSAGTTTVSVIATKDGLSTTKTCAVTVVAAPTPTLTLSASTVTITGSNITDSTTTVSVTNFSGTPTYTVDSSDTSLLTGTVSSGALSLTTKSVTAQTSLTVTVTATYNSETASKSLSVIVKPYIAVTAVTISGSDTVVAGSSITLSATVTGGSDKGVTWSSNATAYATVSSSGVVTGVAAGTAIITATSVEDATVKATKTITVTAATVADQIKVTSTASKYKYSDVNASEGVHGLPSTGTQHMLVLPITISGYESNANATNLNTIKKVLGADAYADNSTASTNTGWETERSFYYKSSYHNLDLQFTVADWYACGMTKSQIVSKNSEGQTGYMYGVEEILSAALANYKTQNNTNCTEFDGNGDGYIDGAIAVYSCPDDYEFDSDSTFWAFSFECIAKDGQDYLTPSTTSPVMHKYFWSSYDMVGTGSYYSAQPGSSKSSSASPVKTIPADAHTCIHESGHMMGLDDYYDYGTDTDNDDKVDSQYSPMAGADMMDNNIIDHNSFSKYALGWENVQVVSGTGGSLAVTLTPAVTNAGQVLLLPTSKGFNGSAFDEYILIEYFTPTDLNYLDSTYAFDTRARAMGIQGIRIFHVDARLCTVTTSSGAAGAYVDTITTTSTTHTTVSHANTIDRATKDGSNYELITLLDHAGVAHRTSTSNANNATLWTDGTSFDFSTYKSQFPSSTAMNDGGSMKYHVAFSNMTSAGVTCTITYVA
jgi:M6 family metalloprotease-like protein